MALRYLVNSIQQRQTIYTLEWKYHLEVLFFEASFLGMSSDLFILLCASAYVAWKTSLFDARISILSWFWRDMV